MRKKRNTATPAKIRWEGKVGYVDNKKVFHQLAAFALTDERDSILTHISAARNIAKMIKPEGWRRDIVPHGTPFISVHDRDSQTKRDFVALAPYVGRVVASHLF